MEIYFVTRKDYAQWEDIEILRDSDVDKMPERFRSGVDVWIAQTYLFLREPLHKRGIECRFTDRFIPGAICIAHRDDLNSYRSSSFQSYVVGIRADRPPLYTSHRCILQNDLFQDNHRYKYIPLWPQPGLLPRRVERAQQISKLAYFGRDSSAPDWFRSADFHHALAELGVVFDIRTDAWYDYRDVDLLLAYREEPALMLRYKPATKLYNAWFAETPALLGPEPAYLSLKRCELDFLSVTTPQDILMVIKQLKAKPKRFQEMIENGRLRAADFSVAAIRHRWVNFLVDEVIPQWESWRKNFHASETYRLSSFIWQLTLQKMSAKLFRIQYALDS